MSTLPQHASDPAAANRAVQRAAGGMPRHAGARVASHAGGVRVAEATGDAVASRELSSAAHAPRIVGYRSRVRWNNVVVALLGIALVGLVAWSAASMEPHAASVAGATDGPKRAVPAETAADSGSAMSASTVRRAAKLTAAGRFAAAATMLERVPAEHRAHLRIPALLRENQRLRKAYIGFSAAAMAHMKQGHWSAAGKSFRNARAIAPLSPSMQKLQRQAVRNAAVGHAYSKATALARAGRYADALRVARRANRKHPDARLSQLIARIKAHMGAGSATSTSGPAPAPADIPTGSGGGAPPPTGSSSSGSAPKRPPGSSGTAPSTPAPPMGDAHAGHDH